MKTPVPTLIPEPAKMMLNPTVCFVPYAGAERLYLRFPTGESEHFVETPEPERRRDKLLRWLQAHVNWVREHPEVDCRPESTAAQRDKLLEFVKELAVDHIIAYAKTHKDMKDVYAEWRGYCVPNAVGRLQVAVAKKLLEQLD